MRQDKPSNPERIALAVGQLSTKRPIDVHPAIDINGTIIRNVTRRIPRRASEARIARIVEEQWQRLEPLAGRFTAAIDSVVADLDVERPSTYARRFLAREEEALLVARAIHGAWITFEASGGTSAPERILARCIDSALVLSGLVIGVTELNDAGAMKELCRRLLPAIRSKVDALLPNASEFDREEICDETRFAVWMNLSRAKAPSLLAFARLVAARQCRGHIRRYANLWFEALPDTTPALERSDGIDDQAEIIPLLRWLFASSEHAGHVLMVAWSFADPLRPEPTPRELALFLGGMSHEEALSEWMQDFHLATAIGMCEIAKLVQPFRDRLRVASAGIRESVLGNAQAIPVPTVLPAGYRHTVTLRSWRWRARSAMRKATKQGKIPLPAGVTWAMNAEPRFA